MRVWSAGGPDETSSKCIMECGSEVSAADKRGKGKRGLRPHICMYYVCRSMERLCWRSGEGQKSWKDYFLCAFVRYWTGGWSLWGFTPARRIRTWGLESSRWV